MIPYGKQSISVEDINSVVEVLKSDFLTQGPKVVEFENALRNYVGAKYSKAFNSATSALHVACLSLGVTQGDWVWTTSITFVASANCALYCGAKVNFVDINPNTLNMSVMDLKQKLKKAKLENRLPKVVIPVHMAGQSCEMEEIYNLSQEYNFKIIEDASHAIGASYKNQKVGSCKYSDITIFSFHPVKIITTAEGGLATTNDSEINEKLELFRSHGITKNEDMMETESHGPWYYDQVELGYNYRMTELQGALGLSQFSKLDKFVRVRNDLAKIYDDAFKELPLKVFTPLSEIYSSYHLYIIQLNEDVDKGSIFKKLRESGIGVNLHYIPVHTQPYYRNLIYSNIFHAPNSELYYQGAISIPLYQDLSEKNQLYVISKIKELLG